MAYKYADFDWYETPVYYDIVFDEDTPRECDFLEAMATYYLPDRSNTTKPIRVLEPACGTGRLMAAMSERGYDVAGFDLSTGMLGFAKERLVDAGLTQRQATARLKQASMQDFSYPKPFDMAHCLVSTFKYLLTDDDAVAHLQCVADALNPGGIYVLGFHLSDYNQTKPDSERWVGKRDGVEVVCNIRGWPPDRKTRLEKVRSRLVVKAGKSTKRYETHWNFRTYSANQFRSVLRQVPDLRHVDTYDFEYDPMRMVTFGGNQLDQICILQKNPE